MGDSAHKIFRYFAVAHCTWYFVSPQEDDAGGDDGVGHEGADAHHVDEVLQVEDLKRHRNDCAEFSQPLDEFTDRRHRAGEQPGEDRGHQRRLRSLVHPREEPAGVQYNQKLNFVLDFECCYCEHPMK